MRMQRGTFRSCYHNRRAGRLVTGIAVFFAQSDILRRRLLRDVGVRRQFSAPLRSRQKKHTPLLTIHSGDR